MITSRHDLSLQKVNGEQSIRNVSGVKLNRSFVEKKAEQVGFDKKYS
jgi:hypothetical protein